MLVGHIPIWSLRRISVFQLGSFWGGLFHFGPGAVSGDKVRFSEFVELLKQSPAKVVERLTQGEEADEANPEVQKIVGHTLDMVDNYLAKLGGRLVLTRGTLGPQPPNPNLQLWLGLHQVRL